jgi:hypothetical protein
MNSWKVGTYQVLSRVTSANPFERAYLTIDLTNPREITY